MAQRHPLQELLFPLLYPVSLLYGAGGRLKRNLYAQGMAKCWLPPSFCISVGNISWGGTGKTPVVDWLLGWCEKNALSAVVLTRGYRSKPPHLPFAVRPDSTPEESGDEPLMLARRHPLAMVLVDPKRSRAGRLAAKTNAPDLFILDDGFQHQCVHRDLNLVLLDSDDVRLAALPGRPASNWNTVIPAGTWREPLSSLSAADAFLIKTSPEEWPALVSDLNKRLQPWPKPVFAFRMAAKSLCPIGNTASSPLEPEQLGPYMFATGIGDPEQAARTAATFLKRKAKRVAAFPDHHDFRNARSLLEAEGLPLVCTGKDSVKIAQLNLSIPCYALEAEAEFFAALPPCPGDEDRSFEAWWEAQWHTYASKQIRSSGRTPEDKVHEEKRFV